MLTTNSINPDPQLSTALAIYFTKLALPVWQQKYPEDSRPEKAIEAAERALFSVDANCAYVAAAANAACDAARCACAAAAADAACAVNAVSAATDAFAAAATARSATYATYAAKAAYAANAAYAASAAANVTYAAYAAGANATYAAGANAAYAASAAANAAYALSKDSRSFVHHHLIQLLPLILWHKITSKRSFGEPEKLFELLPEDCREDFLFNLDSLR